MARSTVTAPAHNSVDVLGSPNSRRDGSRLFSATYCNIATRIIIQVKTCIGLLTEVTPVIGLTVRL